MPQDQVYVAALDQGTTSSRCLVFDTDGHPVATHQQEFAQIHPHPGWHEHDPEELVSSILDCMAGVAAQLKEQNIPLSSVKAAGITNQRETTIVWDRKTGKSLYNAIVWTDTRTSSLVREFKSHDGVDGLAQICGEELTTYPSVTKLLWLIKNVDAVRETYDRGDLTFGTVDSWLIYKLNGGADDKGGVHVTDPTNASRTMFMDIHKLKYSSRLKNFFSTDDIQLDKIHFPEIVRSSDPTAFGAIQSGDFKGLRITGCLGDQSAALVGQKGFDAGAAKNTYGTGCFLLYNVGTTPVISTHKLMSTVAYDFGTPVYALEGSIAVAGSGVKFLVNNMDFAEKSESISELAESVPDSGGLVFVTAFSGLFAPYWIDDAQGTMFGITHHTKKGHIAHATLEAVCFQTKAILDAMAADAGQPLTSLRVDGGMSNSDLTMQIQADVTGIDIIRPEMRETTALGAAMAAGIGIGIWENVDSLRGINKKGETVFKRVKSSEEVQTRVERWGKAVEMTRGWLGVESVSAGLIGEF